MTTSIPEQILRGLLLLLWVSGPVAAEPRPIAFRTVPGGAVVGEVTDHEETVATAPNQTESAYAFTAEAGDVHHYVLHRENFDDMVLAVSWNNTVGQWRASVDGVDMLLNGNNRLDFSKTVQFNTSPPGAEAYIEAPGSSQTLSVAGVSRMVRRLPHPARGYVLPHAYAPPPVYLVRPGFETTVLLAVPGQLDTPSGLVPTVPLPLRPSFGPFSYWQFNIGIVAVIGFGAFGWYGHQQRSRRALERTIEVPRAPEVRPDPSLVGSMLTSNAGERYTIARELGRGGMGAVYEATTSADAAAVHWAVKVLSSAGAREQQERFMREMQICSRLHHPGIVRVVDWGLYRPMPHIECPFMVMDLVDGKTLGQWIEEVPDGLELGHTLTWASEALAALEVAHAAGVIHRDIKPDNIMITSAGHVKLLDFGVARQAQATTLTATGVGMGTPLYMSPEHMNAHHLTPAADIYSLGVVVYCALSGRLPYTAIESVEMLLYQILAGTLVPLSEARPGLPVEVTELVMKMLARDLQLRYATARAVLHDLDPLIPRYTVPR